MLSFTGLNVEPRPVFGVTEKVSVELAFAPSDTPTAPRATAVASAKTTVSRLLIRISTSSEFGQPAEAD